MWKETANKTYSGYIIAAISMDIKKERNTRETVIRQNVMWKSSRYRGD